MEQIINVSGKEYKIISDRTLSNLQLTETIKQIEMMSHTDYKGSIKRLITDCISNYIGKDPGDIMTMESYINSGTPPYKSIKFYKKAANDPIKIELSDCTKTNVGAGTYTCTYKILTTDTYPIEVSTEVIDANDILYTVFCNTIISKCRYDVINILKKLYGKNVYHLSECEKKFNLVECNYDIYPNCIEAISDKDISFALRMTEEQVCNLMKNYNDCMGIQPTIEQEPTPIIEPEPTVEPKSEPTVEQEPDIEKPISTMTYIVGGVGVVLILYLMNRTKK